MKKVGITIFFTFLKYSFGGKVDMNRAIADIDWKQLYIFSSNQSYTWTLFLWYRETWK